MPQSKPMPGEIYRHFKNKTYQIIAVATHSETREPYVVYQALYDDFRTYIRPYHMFISEVDHVKYPQVTQKYRFELMGSNVKAEGLMDEATYVESVETFDKRDDINISCEKYEGKDASQIKMEESETEGLNQKFIAFLDADSYDVKYDIYCSMIDELDDHLINQMAASIDVVIEDGPIDTRIEQLKRGIRTKAKYELHRR
ncbi:MAG: DUF1653 domain-containing protein [Lachnospiraceae bacterium]|nr:DUF1653 domain-containing protein [Lachnospiraceae bacterium]